MIEYIDFTCLSDTAVRKVVGRFLGQSGPVEALADLASNFHKAAVGGRGLTQALNGAKPALDRVTGLRGACWARGPRRGLSMRRRALHLKWGPL